VVVAIQERELLRQRQLDGFVVALGSARVDVGHHGQLAAGSEGAVGGHGQPAALADQPPQTVLETDVARLSRSDRLFLPVDDDG
jgi:hypothetical protein